MRNGRFHPLKDRGKVQKMGVPSPFPKLPKKERKKKSSNLTPRPAVTSTEGHRCPPDDRWSLGYHNRRSPTR
jgi:hypothetical protein